MPTQASAATYENESANGSEPQPLREAYARLRRQLDEHPYQTLAIVAGVGFILGGGLFTRVAARAIAGSLRVGMATAFAPLVDTLLAQMEQPLEAANGRGASDS